MTKQKQVSMEIREDGLIVLNEKGNVYDLEIGKLINIYLGEFKKR